jgi:hypothetical protein
MQFYHTNVNIVENSYHTHTLANTRARKHIHADIHKHAHTHARNIILMLTFRGKRIVRTHISKPNKLSTKNYEQGK